MIDLTAKDFWPVRNDATTPVPPRALMRVTQVDSDGFAHVDMPNSCHDSALLLVNGGTTIPFNTLDSRGVSIGLNYGQGHRRFPAIVAYEGGDGITPANGDIYGPAPDKWGLVRGNRGFVVLGGSSSGFTNVMPEVLTKPFLARILSRTATTCGNSGSGSGDTDHTIYTYTFHSVRAVDDGDGCPAFINDEIDVAISGTAYEVNNHEVAVGTIVEVESVTYTDEQVSGSGSNTTGPAGCRFVFTHEASATSSEVCLKTAVTSKEKLTCDGTNFVRNLYANVFGPDANNCWTIGPDQFILAQTTTWCCANCGDGSGSGPGGSIEPCTACAGCQSSYCIEFLVPSAPSSSTCAGYHNLKITLAQSACNNAEGLSGWYGTASFSTAPNKVTTVNVNLARFCICAGTYKWGIYASAVTSVSGTPFCGWPIISGNPAGTLYDLGTSSSSTTPPTLTGNMSYGGSLSIGYCTSCPDSATYAGTFAISLGICDSSGSGAGDCPCQWTYNAGLLTWQQTGGGGSCIMPLGTGTDGEVRDTNLDGTTCTEGGGGGGACGTGCAAARTAAYSNITGFLLSCSFSNTSLTGGPTAWQTASDTTCTCANVRYVMWCESGTWYMMIEGAGSAFARTTSAGDCGQGVYNLNYGTDNTLCPAQSGSITVTVT